MASDVPTRKEAPLSLFLIIAICIVKRFEINTPVINNRLARCCFCVHISTQPSKLNQSSKSYLWADTLSPAWDEARIEMLMMIMMTMIMIWLAQTPASLCDNYVMLKEASLAVIDFLWASSLFTPAVRREKITVDHNHQRNNDAFRKCRFSLAIWQNNKKRNWYLWWKRLILLKPMYQT